MIENKLKNWEVSRNVSYGGVYTEFYDGDTIYTTEILELLVEKHCEDRKFSSWPYEETKEYFKKRHSPAGIRRTYENSNIRVYNIDCENKTLVDLGCNVGLITTECAKKGAKYCLGIDSMTPVIDIAKFTAEEQGLKNIDFICHEFHDYFEEIVSDKYDIALTLSIENYIGVIEDLERLGHIAPVWYIEPTNHTDHKLSKDAIKEWGETELSKFGNVEFIRFTDYQGRGMFRLTTR
jgi:SAM-dependent methyltransferase